MHSTIIHLKDMYKLCPVSTSFAKVSLIVTTEPLFAAVAAVCCIGETFSLGDYVGLNLSRMSGGLMGPDLPSAAEAVFSLWLPCFAMSLLSAAS